MNLDTSLIEAAADRAARRAKKEPGLFVCVNIDMTGKPRIRTIPQPQRAKEEGLCGVYDWRIEPENIFDDIYETLSAE